MTSRAPKTGKPPASGPTTAKEGPPPRNPRLHAQTRKILLKHYRTKYGVRHRGGGR